MFLANAYTHCPHARQSREYRYSFAGGALTERKIVLCQMSGRIIDGASLAPAPPFSHVHLEQMVNNNLANTAAKRKLTSNRKESIQTLHSIADDIQLLLRDSDGKGIRSTQGFPCLAYRSHVLLSNTCPGHL